MELGAFADAIARLGNEKNAQAAQVLESFIDTDFGLYLPLHLSLLASPVFTRRFARYRCHYYLEQFDLR
jgi:hypothetical protein